MEHTINIQFEGDSLTVLIEDGQPFVAIRPICESLGLDWSTQLRVIKSDEVLSSTVVTKPTVDAADGKRRKMVFLPLNFLQGWLFKISPSKCRADRREKIVAYQRECFRVLHEYFWHGGAINPEADGLQLQVLKGRIEYQETFMPKDPKGESSLVSGRSRVLTVRSYFRAHPRKSADLHPNLFGDN